MNNNTPSSLKSPERDGSYDDRRTTELGSFCPTCGSVHEENGALKALTTRQAKEIASLRRSLADHHRSGPLMDEIRQVFDYWVETLGKRSDTVLGDGRVKAVRARLKEGFTVDRLKRAIDGCKLDDWAMGRVAKAGGKTFNDLAKHICVSDESVERFEQIAAKPQRNVVPLRVPPGAHRPDPWSRPLDRAVAALRREFGTDAVNGSFGTGFRADEWWAVCPLHPERGDLMRMRERVGPGSSLELSCLHGCLPTILLERIRELEAKREERRGVDAA